MRLALAVVAVLPALAASAAGWYDCLPDEQLKARHLDRAWRAFSRAAHPDKGGSTDAFLATTELRALLKDRLRYHARRALDGAYDDRLRLLPTAAAPAPPPAPPPGVGARRARVGRGRARGARARPRAAELGVDDAASRALAEGARYQLALGARNVSVIEYLGDEAEGG